MKTADVPSPGRAKALACDEILRIARQDAERAYEDLDGYRISLVLEVDGWHVEYSLTQPMMAGGGPHYVIDPITGEILAKKYYQ